MKVPISEDIKGIAYFHPISFKEVNQERIIYSGTIKEFLDEKKVCCARNISCTISIQKIDHIPIPLPSSDWIIKGSLKKGNGSTWKLIAQKYLFWKEVPSWFSLTFLRKSLKERTEKFVKNHIPDEKSAHFITGMITGSFSDQEVSASFKKFGLQHILAISGFHFSLLSLIIAFFLKPFMQGKSQAISLIFFMTLYLFFLGASPSIIRAWTMITMGLLAPLIDRRIHSFNALGLALMLVLLYDPSSVCHIGFILSFSITFSILAFLKPMREILNLWSPNRSFETLKKMDTTDKIGHLCISLLKHLTALNLSVNIMAVPLSFICFGTFPVLGLFYNLFFPLMAALIIFLFSISAFFTIFFYPLGKLLFLTTSSLSSFMLHLTLDMPLSWDLQIYYTPNTIMGILFCFIIFFFGIFACEKHSSKDEPSLLF